MQKSKKKLLIFAYKKNKNMLGEICVHNRQPLLIKTHESRKSITWILYKVRCYYQNRVKIRRQIHSITK